MKRHISVQENSPTRIVFTLVLLDNDDSTIGSKTNITLTKPLTAAAVVVALRLVVNEIRQGLLENDPEKLLRLLAKMEDRSD